MRVRLVDDISRIESAAWDALIGEDDPFVEHAFLLALEESRTVGEGTGWLPTHVTAWEGDALVGALPLYEKDHSYGEFIFDWAWAEASLRIGVPYYPKLVSMVPVTPATGCRLLVAAGADRARVTQALLEGAFEAADKLDASSVHLLFLNDDERIEVAADERLQLRTTQQFHWHNEGYGSFEDFLSRFRSNMRKKTRRERHAVAECGLRIEVREGRELTDRDWQALRVFYRDTCAMHGSMPYLTPSFFDLAAERLAHRIVAVLAYDGDEPVAASLNFEKGAHLYGRYWGCRESHRFVHFELCYYRLIERAIERGMQRFEAGAQGMHKLRRGLMPSPIHSAHWVRSPVLDDALRGYLPREARSVAAQIRDLARHGPFRREHIEMRRLRLDARTEQLIRLARG